MTEKDKFAYKMLTDNELNEVSGGTNGEYKELRDLLPMVTVKEIQFTNAGNPLEIETKRKRLPGEVAS